MRGQAGFFDIDERLKQLSAKGDGLERLKAVVDFELFRVDLERAVPRSKRAKGRSAAVSDHVLTFKTLVLQASHNSVRRADRIPRPSPGRALDPGPAFCCPSLSSVWTTDSVPDANTIWGFRRVALTRCPDRALLPWRSRCAV